MEKHPKKMEKLEKPGVPGRGDRAPHFTTIQRTISTYAGKGGEGETGRVRDRTPHAAALGVTLLCEQWRLSPWLVPGRTRHVFLGMVRKPVQSRL